MYSYIYDSYNSTNSIETCQLKYIMVNFLKNIEIYYNMW